MPTKYKPLTNQQKESLSILEPQLQRCVLSADFEKAKSITVMIQNLLRPTGHETRILQAKNWLYECAMESNNLEFAKSGFIGTRKKSSKNTRLYLEATALLGICYLREQDILNARKMVAEAVDNINNIKSQDRRKQFHGRLLHRLEEESVISGLIDKLDKSLDVEEVDKIVQRLIRENKSNEELLLDLGSAIPSKSIDILTDIRNTYQFRLPAPDRKFLPPPLTEDRKEELGRRAGSALKRVAWRSLCHSESDIYKAWSQGLSVVYDKKYIAGAIVVSFKALSISGCMIAASVAALAIKFGAEVFCEIFAPQSIMIDRKDRK